MTGPPPPPCLCTSVPTTAIVRREPEKKPSAYARWACQYPMHAAAQAGHEVLTKALIDPSASSLTFPVTLSPEVCIQQPVEPVAVDAKDSEGWCAIHYAAYEGHADVVKTLCEMKANTMEGQNSGSNALQVAVGMGQKDVVNALVGVLPSDTVHKLILQKNKENQSTMFILENICEINRDDIRSLLQPFQ